METEKSFGCRFANTEKCADSCFKCELFHRDCISREAAINTQERRCLGCPVDRRLCYKCAVTTTTKQLLELPAADVVEVVRCKDCINWNGNDCISGYGLTGPEPMDFCPYGERRANNG